jgi:hypothetical protein
MLHEGSGRDKGFDLPGAIPKEIASASIEVPTGRRSRTKIK